MPSEDKLPRFKMNLRFAFPCSNTHPAFFVIGFHQAPRPQLPKAREKFLRLSLDEERFKEIMEALRTQKGSPQWKRDGGQYIPHPATWIHGERWEDEATPTGDDEPMKDFLGQTLE